MDALHQLPQDKDERIRVLQRNICKHYFLHRSCPSQGSSGPRYPCKFPHLSQADVQNAGLPLEEVKAILDSIPDRFARVNLYIPSWSLIGLLRISTVDL